MKLLLAMLYGFVLGLAVWLLAVAYLV